MIFEKNCGVFLSVRSRFRGGFEGLFECLSQPIGLCPLNITIVDHLPTGYGLLYFTL